MIFFFPYSPHRPPSRKTPWPSHPKQVDFGPFRRGRAGAEALLRIYFCPKSFVYLTFSPRAESVFQVSLNPRAQNAKLGWELAVDFDFAARIRSRILLETGTDFVTHFVTNFVMNFVTKSPRSLSGLFSLPPKDPRQIHATFGAKIHASLGNFFLNSFCGCSTLVCVANEDL